MSMSLEEEEVRICRKYGVKNLDAVLDIQYSILMKEGVLTEENISFKYIDTGYDPFEKHLKKPDYNQKL